MSISSIFAIGLSGVNAQSASLEALSNNIANSNTIGFRRTRTDFSQLVAREQSAVAGDTGTGVSANTRSIINQQGFIDRTQNTTDIAIAGNGFFVVSENAATNEADEILFTRAGDFSINGDGNLINSAGLFLRGQAIGVNGPGNATTLGALQSINLGNIEGEGAATTSASLNAVFSSLAAVSPLAATYNPANPATNLASGAINSDLRQNFTIFDDDGNSTTLTLAFLRTGQNQIAVEAFDPNNPAALALSSGTLQFTPSGALDQANSTFPANIDLSSLDGGDFSTLSLNLESLSIASGANRVISSTSNGAPFGEVTGFEVNDTGILSATFSNGSTRDLFQIPLAQFTNPDGLIQAGTTAFQNSTAAGTLTLAAAGSENFGTIEGGSLETSTVDITQEFSTLIETQRAYAANSRILSIADDLLQTLNETAV